MKVHGNDAEEASTKNIAVAHSYSLSSPDLEIRLVFSAHDTGFLNDLAPALEFGIFGSSKTFKIPSQGLNLSLNVMQNLRKQKQFIIIISTKYWSSYSAA